MAEQQNISQLDQLNASDIKPTDLLVIENEVGTYSININEIIEKYAQNYITQQLCGQIANFANITPPTQEWLPCNGAEYDIEDYPNLAAYLGNSTGTPSIQTKFKVPDLQGYFIRGYGFENTVDKEERTLGSIQNHALQSHTHQTTLNGLYGGTSQGQGLGYYSDGSGIIINKVFDTTQPLGANTSTETRPINKAYPYFIHI